MKQKDIVLIIVVAFVSGVIALLVSNTLISPAKNRTAKVEVVEPIVADFNPPDDTYFNTSSVNPTKLIRLQGNQNNNPFTDEN